MLFPQHKTDGLTVDQIKYQKYLMLKILVFYSTPKDITLKLNHTNKVDENQMTIVKPKEKN